MNLFAQRLTMDGKPGPFQTFVEAVEPVNSGETDEAKSRFRSILVNPNLETRTTLWVWSALRELGERPDTDSAKEILGVVVEVPMRGAYDTLAAYQEGSARYLNFSGAAIFWDAHDETVTMLSRAFIASSVSVATQAKPRIDVSLPKQGTQVTPLTRSGPYVLGRRTPHQVCLTSFKGKNSMVLLAINEAIDAAAEIADQEHSLLLQAAFAA